ncbi:MAG: cytochrome c [candidate division Zixibacteria bacterium]|nr:cytochrome c [candidate division Zixibacteria bacterium]
MKNFNRPFTTLLVSLFATGGMLALVFAQTSKPTFSGKELYGKKCASCHGKQGEGVPKMATMLKTTIRDLRMPNLSADTLAAWKKSILDGKKKMPSFKTKLSAAEIDSALAYTVALAKAGQSEKTSAGSDSTKGAIK